MARPMYQSVAAPRTAPAVTAAKAAGHEMGPWTAYQAPSSTIVSPGNGGKTYSTKLATSSTTGAAGPVCVRTSARRCASCSRVSTPGDANPGDRDAVSNPPRPGPGRSRSGRGAAAAEEPEHEQDERRDERDVDEA